MENVFDNLFDNTSLNPTREDVKEIIDLMVDELDDKVLADFASLVNSVKKVIDEIKTLPTSQKCLVISRLIEDKPDKLFLIHCSMIKAGMDPYIVLVAGLLAGRDDFIKNVLEVYVMKEMMKAL